ncbi:MAG: response regulator [Pseudomonadota bacterium]
MPRRLLVIHESHLIRKIVTSYALSELSDLIVEKADYASLGLQLLREKKYDIVLSAMEMAGLDGLELFRKTRESGPNQETPFVIMTSTDDPRHHERIRKKGIVHILSTPFTSAQLAGIVDKAVSPRDMRKYTRFSILGTEAEVETDDRAFGLKILNVSVEGMMGEIQYDDWLVTKWKINRVSLTFPEEFGQARARGVLGVICRVEVLSWRADETPETVRVAWKFTHVPELAQKTLEMILDRVEKDYNLASSNREIQQPELDEK